MLTAEGKPLTTLQERTVNRLVAYMQRRFRDYDVNKRQKTFYWYLNRMLADDVLLTVAVRSEKSSGILALTDQASIIVVDRHGDIIARYRMG